MSKVIDKSQKTAIVGTTANLPTLTMSEQQNDDYKQRVTQDLSPNFDNFPEYFTPDYMLSLNEEELLTYYKKYDPVYFENSFNLSDENEKIKNDLEDYVFSLTPKDFCRLVSEEGITIQDRHTIKLLYGRSEFFRDTIDHFQEVYQELEFNSVKLLEYIVKQNSEIDESHQELLDFISETKKKTKNSTKD